MAPNDSRNVRELSSPPSSNSRSGNIADVLRCLHNETSTGTTVVARPISGNPLHHGEILQKLHISSCPPGEQRLSPTTGVYNSLFTKWVDWCQPRDRNPAAGPIEDIVNFLADLHKEGYQYRSLNSYHSATSAVHEQVDDYPVGQHPLVTRMLKSVFNKNYPYPGTPHSGM